MIRVRTLVPPNPPVRIFVFARKLTCHRRWSHWFAAPASFLFFSFRQQRHYESTMSSLFFYLLLTSLLCLLSYDESPRPPPKVLDLRFSCFPSFLTSLLSNDYDIMYDNMYAFLARSFAIKAASISFSMSFLFTRFE
jgi:hypothetical protein